MGPDIIDEISTHHYVNNQLKSMFLNLFFSVEAGWFYWKQVLVPQNRNPATALTKHILKVFENFEKKSSDQQTNLDIGDLCQITKKNLLGLLLSLYSNDIDYQSF